MRTGQAAAETTISYNQYNSIYQLSDATVLLACFILFKRFVSLKNIRRTNNKNGKTNFTYVGALPTNII